MSIFDDPAFSSRLFFPWSRVSPTPPHAIDHRVRAANGAALALRVHERLGRGPLVLLFHGNGEVVADYDDLAPMFADVGADLAVLDYRGYGASEGEPTLRGILDDAPIVLRHVVGLAGGRPVVVLGRSLGSACAAELCRADLPGTAAFVFDSALARLEGLLERRGMRAPAPFTKEELERFDPLPKVARATRPTLVVHGAEDDLVHPDEGRALFDALGVEAKSLVLVEGAGHNDLFAKMGYWRALERFFTSLAGAS